MYKAIVIDVDETLVESRDALPTKKVAKAIYSLQEQSIHIILATARPYQQIKQIVDYLNLSGLSIMSDGAEIIDVSTGKSIQEYLLDKEKMFQVSGAIRKEKNTARIWVQDNGIDIAYTPSYIAHKPFVMVVADLLPKEADTLIKQLLPIANIFITKAQSYKSGYIDLHIGHGNATKAKGISFVMQQYAIRKNEIVGVGDGHNDIGMFMVCGTTVAMGNAVEEIKAIADNIVPSVRDDGLATAIETYFPSRDQ